MKETKLFDVHQKLGAKIVDFAGFKMPVQYSSIIAEHKAVRNSVGVFDVSHMGEIFILGERALDFIQEITVNDASKLTPGRVQYSAMCYKDGGMVDDLLVYKLNDEKFMFVVNASNIENDYNWMVENNSFGVDIINESNEYTLLAIQGPNSKNVLQKICDKDLDIEYYHFFNVNVAGVNMIVSRTGYTGELGYEIYFKGDKPVVENVWNKVFDAGEEFDVKPVGLGARDTLRLEMGFCLYGNDIDKTTNPLEAGLGWITKLKKKHFIAKDILQKVKEVGLRRKLVPLETEERVFPRHGYDLTAAGRKIGNVTSGTVSPILEKPIALGYVEKEFAYEGATVNFMIRGREVPAKVVKLPFLKK